MQPKKHHFSGLSDLLRSKVILLYVNNIHCCCTSNIDSFKIHDPAALLPLCRFLDAVTSAGSGLLGQ